MLEPWKILFARALAQLGQSGLAQNNWALGGGTVLMHNFNHRESKDIDIFFTDPQLLNFISPRINDAVATSLADYSEQGHYTRLHFKEGEIDFIVARQVSRMQASFIKISGAVVNVEHPVEVVAKKIYYRAEEFKPRDVFDLAVVFNAQKDSILENADAFAEKLSVLVHRLNELQDSGSLDVMLSKLAVLPGGEKVRGKELELCRQFIQLVEKELKSDHFFNGNTYR